MTDERLNYHIGTTGAQKAEADFRRVSASITQSSVASGQASQSVSALGGAVGNLGTVVASASPAMGQFGGVVGTAASAVSGLTSVLGGVGGLVAGGLIAAVGLLASSLASASSETKQLDEETKKLNNTIEKQIGLIKEREAALGLRQRVALGAGSITEQQAEVERLQRRLDLTNQAARGGRLSPDAARRAQDLRRRLEQELAEARSQLAAARQEQAREALGIGESDVGTDLLTDAERSARGRTGDAARKRAEADRRAFENTIGGIAGNESQEDFLRRTDSREVDRFLESQTKAQETLTDREKEHAKERLRIFEENLAKRESMQIAHDERMKASLMSFGEQGAEAFTRLALGQEDAGKAIIASIGNQMVAEGSRYIFRGGLELLGGNPAGAAMLALGGAEVAAGYAFGAALGSPAGGGNRGTPEAKEPTRVDRRDDQIRRTTVVYRIDAMVADENAGERIRQALERNERVRGAA